MGKKFLRQASPKISMNPEKTMKKQQLNSLMIQILRPKVYITDSSNFKTLVQELTGNGSSSSSSPTTHDPAETVPVDYHGHGKDPEMSNSCMEAVSDTSLDSFEPCSYNYYYYPVSSSYDDMVYNNEIFQEETATTSTEYLLMNHHLQQQAELLEYQQDLESWLLDMEPAYSSCNVSAHHPIQQEVSIYDYEISGLI